MNATLVGLTVAVLMWGACVGAGALVLSRLALLRDLGSAERLGMCFALGFGGMGWIVFFLAAAGMIQTPVLAALVALGLVGLVLLARTPASDTQAPEHVGVALWLLIAGLVFVLACDFCEGLAPPADADSLAYHFALPKQFLAAGHLEFVPRAVDGAVPLLPQMTYLSALGLGGERAMTLWAMVSGWMPALLLYGVCRPHVGRNWALAAALALLTTPAILYGGGSGQVEPRMATMGLAAAVAAGRAVGTRRLAPAGIAGLLSGFIVASKFTGLLFGAVCAAPLIAHRRAPAALVTYGVAAIVAGFQWYGWNYIHSGDPIFPLLFSALHMPDSAIWTKAQDAVFHAIFSAAENPLPHSVFWFFAYPFAATLVPDPTIESGRTGLGSLGLILLPFAILGAWRARNRLASQPLGSLAVVAVGYYVLWWVTASSERVRHLVIVYPMLLACFVVAAARWSSRAGALKPVAAALALTIGLQLGAQTVFAASYLRHLVTGESRDAFLSRSVQRYDVVPWINAKLTQSDRILVMERQLVYLIDVPVFYAHPVDETVIDIGLNAIDPARFWRQLQAQGVTHLLTGSAASSEPYARMSAELAAAGCSRVLATISAGRFVSRTLPGEDRTTSELQIVALDRTACRL